MSKPKTVAEALERIRYFHRNILASELSREQRADLLALEKVIAAYHHLRNTTPLDDAVQATGLDEAVAAYYNKWVARWNNGGEG